MCDSLHNVIMRVGQQWLKKRSNKVECQPGNNGRALKGTCVTITQKRVEESLLKVHL